MIRYILAYGFIAVMVVFFGFGYIETWIKRCQRCKCYDALTGYCLLNRMGMDPDETCIHFCKRGRSWRQSK